MHSSMVFVSAHSVARLITLLKIASRNMAYHLIQKHFQNSANNVASDGNDDGSSFHGADIKSDNSPMTQGQFSALMDLIQKSSIGQSSGHASSNQVVVVLGSLIQELLITYVVMSNGFIHIRKLSPSLLDCQMDNALLLTTLAQFIFLLISLCIMFF